MQMSSVLLERKRMASKMDALLDHDRHKLKGAAAALARLVGSADLVEQARTESGAYRLSFNDQFFIEAEDLGDEIFRVSTRVVRLSHSLTTRETQALDALKLFTTIRHMVPGGLSLAVSRHDRCLRLVMEYDSALAGSAGADLMQFIHSAHAFRQLFMRSATTK